MSCSLGKETPVVVGVDGVEFGVADVESASAFLEAVFGAVVVEEASSAGHRRVLQFGSTKVLPVEAAEGAQPTEPRNSDVGGWHLAFVVEDCSLALEAIRDYGGGCRVMEGPDLIEAGYMEGRTWCYFRTPWCQMEVGNNPERSYKGQLAMRRPPQLEYRGLARCAFLDHVGLTVPSLDEATEFLEFDLGAQALYDDACPPRKDDWMTKHLDVHKDASLKLRMFRLGDGAQLEVFEYSSPDQPATSNIAEFDQVGGYRLRLAVSDLKETRRRLEAKNFIIHDDNTFEAPALGENSQIKLLQTTGTPLCSSRRQ